MVMQSCKNWKGLIGILGLCVCAGLLIDLQDLTQHSFSPVFDWIDTKPEHPKSLITKPKEPKVMENLPKNKQDQVKIDMQKISLESDFKVSVRQIDHCIIVNS